MSFTVGWAIFPHKVFDLEFFLDKLRSFLYFFQTIASTSRPFYGMKHSAVLDDVFQKGNFFGDKPTMLLLNVIY